MATVKAKTVEEYIRGFPESTQMSLEQLRMNIKKTAPDAEEVISYGIPAFTINKTYLFYFAGYKNHVSIYPAPRGSEAFEKELASYRAGKGTIKFSLDRKLPLGLISKIIKYSVRANKDRSVKKKK